MRRPRIRREVTADQTLDQFASPENQLIAQWFITPNGDPSPEIKTFIEALSAHGENARTHFKEFLIAKQERDPAPSNLALASLMQYVWIYTTSLLGTLRQDNNGQAFFTRRSLEVKPKGLSANGLIHKEIALWEEVRTFFLHFEKSVASLVESGITLDQQDVDLTVASIDEILKFLDGCERNSVPLSPSFFRKWQKYFSNVIGTLLGR